MAHFHPLKKLVFPHNFGDPIYIPLDRPQVFRQTIVAQQRLLQMET